MTETEIKWLSSTSVKVFFDCDKQALKKREEEWLFENKNSIKVTAQREHTSNLDKNRSAVLIYFNKKEGDCR